MEIKDKIFIPSSTFPAIAKKRQSEVLVLCIPELSQLVHTSLRPKFIPLIKSSEIEHETSCCML